MENNNLFGNVRRIVKNWWVSLLIGVLSIVLGIWCYADPLSTYLALSIVFVAGFFITGILEITFALSNRNSLHNWGWTLAIGIIDVIFSIILIFNPLLAPQVFSLFIAFWLLFQSFWGIGMSIDLSKYKNTGWGWLLAIAILGLILSVYLLFHPLFTGIFTAAFVATVFVIYGIFRIILAFKLRSMNKYLS